MSMLENFIWRSAWTLLTVLTVARVAYGVQFQSVGAVGPAMVQDLSLAYASLGTLVGAYSMLGVVLALPAGWLIAQLGDRRIVLAGLGFMILGGLLLAAAPGFPVALTGRLISGAGGVPAAGFPADDHHESLHRHRDFPPQWARCWLAILWASDWGLLHCRWLDHGGWRWRLRQFYLGSLWSE